MSFYNVQQRTSSGLSDIGQFPETIVGSMGSAIIERGSNANGEYVKFADGTLLCSSSRLSLGTASIGNNVRIDFNFATQFINTNISHSFYSSGTSSGNIMSIGNAYSNGPTIDHISTTRGRFAIYTYRYTQEVNSYWYINSIGRWK